MSKKERVLVVGGGFGGVKAALELSEDERFDITLISDDSDLRYYPTLYLTATGGKRANSSIPFIRIFENKDVKIVQSTAKLIDRKAKTITTADGKVFEYDSLILSLGVITNYFGIPGLSEFSYSIKTQTEVAKFKAHLHKQLVEEKHLDLNYVVVGAGPSGIELAGALPDYLNRIAKNHGLKPQKPHIDLVEALPRLLPRLPKDTSRAVSHQLRKLGVKIYLGSAVQGESADELTINGKPLRSHTVIWTAGVTNHPFFSENQFVITKRGKVSVDTYLQAEDNIYVLGDNANTPFSGMAQTALHDGAFAAKNLIRKMDGKQQFSYVAKMPVTVIPAGPRWAAVCWGKVRLYGWLGWILREAADLSGFHDLEPWHLAAKQWIGEFSSQDDCIVCAIAENK